MSGPRPSWNDKGRIRSRNSGDFDIVFSYGGITWDTGDDDVADNIMYSGGQNGLVAPGNIVGVNAFPGAGRLFQRQRRCRDVL